MYDNYNYPPGADTPDAPWNQPSDPDPIELECDTCITLRKEITVETSNYWTESDAEGYTETHLEDNYKDVEKLINDQHTSLIKMLDELAKYVKGELAGGDVSNSRKRELEQLLEDCQGWSVDLIEIEGYEAIG